MNKRNLYIEIFKAILNVLGLSKNTFMLEGRLLKTLIPE
jgi:hypothetical protein